MNLRRRCFQTILQLFFFQNETFCNILVVHSIFTFYLNLVLSRPVRKAFKISSVCWTKALLKGRLLLGGLRSVFLDFDSFITCEESMKMIKFSTPVRNKHVSSPWRGFGPSFWGTFFETRGWDWGAGEWFFNILTGDIDWWPKDFLFPKFGHRTFEDSLLKKRASWESLGVLLAFWCFCFCRKWIDQWWPGRTTVRRDQPPPAFYGFQAVYRCSHGGAV